MTIKELRDINKKKLENAKWREEIFNDAKKIKIGINQNGLNEAKTDIAFHSKVEEIIEENTNFKTKLERWLELLRIDGCNSKSMVANDIQAVLKEISND